MVPELNHVVPVRAAAKCKLPNKNTQKMVSAKLRPKFCFDPSLRLKLRIIKNVCDATKLYKIICLKSEECFSR